MAKQLESPPLTRREVISLCFLAVSGGGVGAKLSESLASKCRSPLVAVGACVALVLGGETCGILISRGGRRMAIEMLRGAVGGFSQRRNR